MQYSYKIFSLILVQIASILIAFDVIPMQLGFLSKFCLVLLAFICGVGVVYKVSGKRMKISALAPTLITFAVLGYMTYVTVHYYQFKSGAVVMEVPVD